MHPLLHRLRERKLVQWALAYLACAWLALQVLDVLGDTYAWPSPVMRAIPLLLGVGLLTVLVLAWYHGEQGQQRVSGPELLMLFVLLVMAGGVVWFVGMQSPASASASGGAGAAGAAATSAAGPSYSASVAVLPFANLSGGSENEYFSDGITEEIISELARIEGLKVISRTSVVALKGSRLTLPQIADTLGVRHVLEGSVRRVDDRVRVTAQLIDPRTDTHLWSGTFNRQLTDIFQIQSEIAGQVSSALMTTVAALLPRAAGSRTDETAAYDAYLRGTFARQQHSPDALTAAVAAFERAIAADSTYAPAYAGLASAHALWTVFGYRGGPDAYSRVAHALALADRAVALDSTLPEAYAHRGHARLRAWMPPASVLEDLEHAVRLAPNSGEIRALYGLGLAYAGRYDEAVPQTEIAVALDPLQPGLHDLRANILSVAGDVEESMREARRAEVLEPRFPNPLRQQARALLLMGRFQECAALGGSEPHLTLRAMCLHSAGQTSEAAAIIRSLSAAANSGRSNRPTGPSALAGDIAEYHAWIGDVEGTIQWLTRAAESSPAIQFLVIDAGTYDRIRTEPRFQTQLERIRQDIRLRVERARQ
jgi:adenylate cyclase